MVHLYISVTRQVRQHCDHRQVFVLWSKILFHWMQMLEHAWRSVREWFRSIDKSSRACVIIEPSQENSSVFKNILSQLSHFLYVCKFLLQTLHWMSRVWLTKLTCAGLLSHTFLNIVFGSLRIFSTCSALMSSSRQQTLRRERYVSSWRSSSTSMKSFSRALGFWIRTLSTSSTEKKQSDASLWTKTLCFLIRWQR